MRTIVVVLSLLTFLFIGCNKVDDNKLIKKKVEIKKIKKHSGKALPQTKYNIAKKELGKNQAVMFEIGSHTCIPCKQMALMLEELKEDYPKFKVFFIDVGKERFAAKDLKIQMIPTQVFYDKNGKEIFRHVGKYRTKELLVTKLKEIGFKM